MIGMRWPKPGLESKTTCVGLYKSMMKKNYDSEEVSIEMRIYKLKKVIFGHPIFILHVERKRN
jgi:hypothetical protein